MDREAARIGVAGLDEGGEGTGELLGGARHSGGQEQHADTGGQFAVGQQPAVDVEGLRTERTPHDAGPAGSEPGLGVAGHAESRERGQGRPDRLGPLPPAERRQRVLDEGLGPLVEQPGRLSGPVHDDGPARRRDGVPVDADELQGLGVDPGGVPGEGVQDDGTVRAHGVEVVPRGQPRRIGEALGEVAGVPAVPGDPPSGRGPPDGLPYRTGHVRERGHGGMAEVEGERRRRHAESATVQVGIVDAGEQGGPAQVDHAGAGSDQRRDVVPLPDGTDDASGHRQGRGDGELRVDRDHPSAHEHQIRVRAHRKSFHHRAHQGTRERSPEDYGRLPARRTSVIPPIRAPPCGLDCINVHGNV